VSSDALFAAHSCGQLLATGDLVEFGLPGHEETRLGL
jgi:hypothetical protein